MGAFLWDDPDHNQWSEIAWIMEEQMNWWIYSGQGFIGAFDRPWSEWSRITDPNTDHLNATHPMHPGIFGSHANVRAPVRTTGTPCKITQSLGMATQIQHEVFWLGITWLHGLFRDKKQQQSRVRLNFNVCTDVENKERAKKKKGDDFFRGKTWKLAVRNASHQQGENKRLWKTKANRNTSNKSLVNTYDISYKRWVTRKFYVVVVQDNVKEIYKKSVLHVQSCFLLIRAVDFFCRSRCRRRLALHDFVFFFVSVHSKYINENIIWPSRAHEPANVWDHLCHWLPELFRSVLRKLM